MAEPLTKSDAEFLRGVVNDSAGSIRNSPTANRATTAERVSDTEIQISVKSGGANDPVPIEVADQLLEPGYEEVRSMIPDERAFRGTVAE